MILLGSIERIQLQSLLSIQLGRQRRLDHLSQLAQDNGTQHHHLSSLGSDSTPSSPCIDPHARISNAAAAPAAAAAATTTTAAITSSSSGTLIAPTDANACQGVRFLVRAQQV